MNLPGGNGAPAPVQEQNMAGEGEDAEDVDGDDMNVVEDFPLVLAEEEEEEIIVYPPVTPFFLPQYDNEVQPSTTKDPLLASALASQDQSPQDFVDRMNTLFNEGETELFETSLIAYFCNNICGIFSPRQILQDMLHPTYDEEAIQQRLIGPMQKLLLGTNAEDFFDMIQKTDAAIKVCGKVFRPGEATYSCRDCGADPTCVLCAECFSNSQHKNHRYKIGSSSGGGYCDCGDSEAWKQDSVCTKHKPENTTQELTLSDRQSRIAHSIFKTTLNYANEILSNKYAVSVESIPNLTENLVLGKDGKFLFSAILYNDEVHTFELVIHALTRTLQMEKRVAADFASKVDREGRAIVFSGSFSECMRVKDSITRFAQRNTERPLKVEIRQSALVAHQHWAEYILKWITAILNKSSSYREIFANFAIEPQQGISHNTFISIILLNDTMFWKSIRTLWHNLIVAGFLKDYNLKVMFAQAFANSYCEMMAEFSEDEEDHANSVTSLSVQILTVPSIAHFLIEKCDFFFTVMRTIISEVETRVDDGVVLFERRGPDTPLRRTQYCLVDLKYLLTTPPPSFTQAFRRNFHTGLVKFFEFCRYLQGSDPIIRRIGDHLEYEPEWENPFNVHIKLSPVMTHVLEWCGKDSILCSKAYSSILREIAKLKVNKEIRYHNEVFGHNADCSYYDLSREPVSIYCALTRLHAGLFIKAVAQGLAKDITVKPQDIPLPEVIMEPSLRTLTLLSQQQVGLWKRNGYSLTNQMYFYQSVRCRGDMYDKDILALQIALAQMDPDVFLINVLFRMELLVWTKGEGFENPVGWRDEDNDRFMPPLTEELMLLLMYLVSSRFVPGVGEVSREDCIRKHIIQSLCIGPMTHSELNKCLSEDVHGETGMEELVRDLTENRKTPQGDVYELKSDLHSEYDVFFHHYTREDASKADDTQRARRTAAKEPDYFLPPRLPQFTKAFKPILRLFKSDILQLCIKTALKDWLVLVARCKPEKYSESMVRKIFHVIAYGINEEMEARDRGEESIGFIEKLEQHEIVPLLEDVMQAVKSFSQKEAILWFIVSYKSLQRSNTTGSDLEAAEAILLREKELEKIRKEKAAAARARSVAQISSLQKRFRTANADLFEDEVPAEESEGESKSVDAICLGPKKTPPRLLPEEFTCILCKVSQSDGLDGQNVFVVGCFVQLSTVLTQARDPGDGYPLAFPPGFREWQEYDPILATPAHPFGVFIETCGHVMHKNCWKRHCDNGPPRERRRPYRPLGNPDSDLKETFCPMCNSLQNAVMPVFPALHTMGPNLDPPKEMGECPDILSWNNLLYASRNTNWVCEKLEIWTFESEPDYDCLTQKDLANMEFIKNLFWKDPQSGIPPQLLTSTEDFLKRVYEITLPTTHFLQDLDQPDIYFFMTTPLHVWNALAYTITSMEMSSRELNVPFFGPEVSLRQHQTLKHLIRFGGSSIDSLNKPHVMAAQYIALRISRILFMSLTSPYFPTPPKLATDNVDAFSLFVLFTYSMRFFSFSDEIIQADYSFVPRPGTQIDAYIFEAVFMFHCLQILLEMSAKDYKVPPISKKPDYNEYIEDPTLHTYYIHLLGLDPVEVDFLEIDRKLEERVVPFVSCCCKFYEHYTGIEAVQFQGQGTSLASMLKYLGQPTDLKDFFDLEKGKLTQNMLYQAAGSNPSLRMLIYPRDIKPFASLPKDYLDLINSVANFSCAKNKEFGLDSKHPTLCLICHRILCSQSMCCQSEMNGIIKGACTEHMWGCGFGTGIFLRIRDCKAFILSGIGKGAFVPPPYVDEYGETDQGLRRGNPLTYSHEKYESLRKLYVEHGIHDEIIRLNERNSNVPAFLYTDWTRM